MNQSANATQVGGNHYKVENGLQHWDLIDPYRVGYLEGCATKYVTRWRRKDGLRDLEKALHYLTKLYESRASLPYSVQVERQPAVPHPVIADFVRDNAVPPAEAHIISLILSWQSTHTLQLAKSEIRKLIAGATSGPLTGDAEASIGYVNQDR